VKKSVALSLSALALFSALSAVGCTPAAQDRARTQNVPVHPAPPAPAPRTMTPTPAPAPAPATYRSAPEIARRVASVPGVSSASVLVSGRTAYVAVNTGTVGDRTHGRTTTGVPDRTISPGTTPGTMGTTPRTWDVSDHLKQRITDVVKQTDPNITTVYVSANPAVFSRFEAFARDLASGRPVTSLADLTDMIRRIWPTAR
jgi:YhcN/YlaJ family sporulation lipoprotein